MADRASGGWVLKPLSLEEVASRAAWRMSTSARRELQARAGAGVVLTSAETVELVEDERLRFVRVGPASLKGIAPPVTLYRVIRHEPR